MDAAIAPRMDLTHIRQMKKDGCKFAMLTAYDYPTASAAQAAGVHILLIGDSMGCVLLGHENTRNVPLSLMLTLGEAVRRGAPNLYLIGDLPFESMNGGEDAVLEASRRFCDEAGCDAVKFEARPEHVSLTRRLTDAGIPAVAHIGLLPQSIAAADGYRAVARMKDEIDVRTDTARRLAEAGAVMILLEAVPNEASQAVVAAVDVPVIGCGAGPACDGHVVVTQDMLGIGAGRKPRFVPVLAHLQQDMEAAMRRWVEDIDSKTYPTPKHVYGMKKT